MKEPLGQKELFLKAIELDPTASWAYNALGATLKRGERIAVRGMKEPLGQKELFLKAIELDPTASWAYNALGTTLKRGERIAVRGIKDPLGQKELFLKAIELDPTLSSAYYNLGKCLASKESLKVRLADGRVMSRKELLVQAEDLEKPGGRDRIRASIRALGAVEEKKEEG